MIHDKFWLSHQILHHLSGLVAQRLRLWGLVIVRIQSRDHTTKVVHPVIAVVITTKCCKPSTLQHSNWDWKRWEKLLSADKYRSPAGWYFPPVLAVVEGSTHPFWHWLSNNATSHLQQQNILLPYKIPHGDVVLSCVSWFSRRNLDGSDQYYYNTTYTK